jgi:hypothetical protein
MEWVTEQGEKVSKHTTDDGRDPPPAHQLPCGAAWSRSCAGQDGSSCGGVHYAHTDARRAAASSRTSSDVSWGD